MPRKAAPPPEGTEVPEPRRSSRIKEQPKPEPPVKKAPAKPRSKKESDGAVVTEEGANAKPVSGRGKKRPAEETVGEGEDKPVSKKVCIIYGSLR
jgi:hypothetical protein